jgi:hypothetical protein
MGSSSSEAFGSVAYSGVPLILRRPKMRSCRSTGTSSHFCKCIRMMRSTW